MEKGIKILGILLITLFFTNCGEDGTIGLIQYGDLSGKVVEKEGYFPLENVKVTLSPTNNTVFTDAEGVFLFEEVEAQDYSVQVSKEGYLDEFEGATVSGDGVVNVVFEMEISTIFNTSPTKPELLTPEDGEEGLLNEVELTWESTDSDEDELTYIIEIRNDFNNDITRITDLTDKSYTLSDLKYGAKYFWTIEVNDGINTEVISSISSFTIKEYPENRYFYVKNEGGNNIIYSSSFNDLNNEVSNSIQLTNSSLNSWRPRKNNVTNIIAFLRIDNNETHLYTMNQDGSNVFKVTSEVAVAGFNLNEIDFSWSTNGEKIIYPSYDKLYSINKDGSGLQQIFQTPNGHFITECDWSNDGTLIALKTNDVTGYSASVYTINMSGTIITTVLSGIKGAVGGINISTDNKLLLYAYDVSEYETQSYRQLDTNIFVYNFATTVAKNLSIDKPAGTLDLDPRFSPNESEIIFVNTSNDGVSLKSIYKVDLDYISSVDLRVLLFSDGTMPDWE